MSADLLRERVYSLSERFSWLGIGPDIAAMAASELEGVLRFLLRHAGE